MDTPATPRPRPLRSRAFVTALVVAAIATLVLLGILSPEDGERWLTVAGLWITAGVTGGIIVATSEPVVTPLSDPRNDQGEALTPEGR